MLPMILSCPSIYLICVPQLVALNDINFQRRLYGNGALLPMILMNLTPPLSRLSTKHILKTALIQGVARLTQSSSLFAAQIWV
ncbi:hypothetical protein G6F21_014650 [Rhizopus arrhizus]|nr:hypothetical protein G6F21_014650 [Rhizopus arrhizus]KAG0904778.1 hypothetical protein G6F32_017278 [Rhizopus arrhizus]KAG0906900.1 hypothetical protein G6F31_021734 [Rhizopus arrhizus]KAG1063499.1 hypothetical protein G6F40_017898 [Rhizopus arrhizus]